MEGNFYIGIVRHRRKFFRLQYDEKIVLYSNNNIEYIDLINNVVYSTDSSDKSFVVKESLIPTNIFEHRIDYMYLLYQYNSKVMIRRKKNNHS